MSAKRSADERFMAVALALARRGHGSVAPNPAVGCVIVRDGRVVGRGWTQPGGRPHAETEALRRAGGAARGATAYVTLEPCAHQGATGPCADALAAAGVARAVVALRDPDPRVDGRGVARLAAAGVAVDVGVGAEAAAEAAAGFLSRVRRGRPLVTLKTATTLDGRIAAASGASKWITGPEARAAAHGLRARSDAVLVGAGTVAADDPELTCRLPGLDGRSPVRVVLCGRGAVPAEGRLAATAGGVPTWIVVAAGAGGDAGAAWTEAGAEVIEVAAAADGRPDAAAALRALGGRGINRLMVEGGGRVAASLLRRGLVDRLVWFREPLVMGGDGTAAVAALGAAAPDDAPRFVRLSLRPVGSGSVETLKRAG